MRSSNQVVLSILCEFWHEDKVWNGTAKDLPIAVFGKTFEMARKHMQNAIWSYIEATVQAGDLPKMISALKKTAGHPISVQKMPPNRPIMKLSVAMRNRKIVAVA